MTPANEETPTSTQANIKGFPGTDGLMSPPKDTQVNLLLNFWGRAECSQKKEISTASGTGPLGLSIRSPVLGHLQPPNTLQIDISLHMFWIVTTVQPLGEKVKANVSEVSDTWSGRRSEAPSARDSWEAQKQWRSQNTADASAQRGHTKFASSLKPRPRQALSRLQCGMQKQVGGSGGCSPQKFWNF